MANARGEGAMMALAEDFAATPYHPIAPLGHGAMGAVYEAEHRTLKRRLVIKVLREPNRPDLEDRLRLEAQALAQLSHPNVLAVVDYARTASGQPFLVSERLYGQTLKALVGPTGALPVPVAVKYVQQALLGLSAAHKLGIVHRDVKLDNLFLTEGDELNPPRVVVIDFGIAKLVGAEGGPAPVAPLENPTAEGIMVGTPSFMSPEQVSNLKVDHRADIYGAGVVLYRLLAGRAPFICRDLLEYASAHAMETPAPPSRFAALPPGLDAVVLRALEKKPEHRFASAKDMIDALEPFSSPTGPNAPAHGPDSLPTAPLPKSPPRQIVTEFLPSPPQGQAPAQQVAVQGQLAKRGTEVMMQAPPRGNPTQLSRGGTELAMESPARGTELLGAPTTHAHGPVPPTVIGVLPSARPDEPTALPAPRSMAVAPSAVSTRKAGLTGVEKAALVIALLAGAAILWFSVRLLLAA